MNDQTGKRTHIFRQAARIARREKHAAEKERGRERIAHGWDTVAKETSMLCGVHGVVPVRSVQRDRIILVCGCARQIH